MSGGSNEKCIIIDMSNMALKHIANKYKTVGKEGMLCVDRKDINQSYDILYFKSLDGIAEQEETVDICRELLQKGKVIYRMKEDENSADFIFSCRCDTQHLLSGD